ESRAGDAVGDAVHALRTAPGSALVEAAATAAGLQEQLTDLARDLRGLAETFDDDPDALEAAQNRRAQLAELARKYGPTLEEVVAFGKRAAASVAELEGYEERAQGALATRERAVVALDKAAAVLSSARRKAAAAVARAV